MKDSLGITANLRKNGALLAYIANKVPGVNLRKLLKIVYLIDERFIELQGFPLTWFNYYVWEKGPVAPEVYDIKTGNSHFSEYVVPERSNENGKVIVRPLFPIDNDPKGPFGELSPYDLSVIDDELEKYSDKTADWLTDQTHLPDTLWSKTQKERAVKFVNGKSDCRMDLSQLVSEDSDLYGIYEDAEWNMAFQARINAHKS